MVEGRAGGGGTYVRFVRFDVRMVEQHAHDVLVVLVGSVVQRSFADALHKDAKHVREQKMKSVDK